MTISSIKPDTIVDKLAESMQKTKTGTKNAFKSSMSFMKDLPKDTCQFVKTKPKKAGKFAAIGILAGAAIYGVKTAILNFINTKKENNLLKDINNELLAINAVKDEHIENRGEIIEALQESCEDSQAIIDAQHGALEIAHSAHSEKAE